MSEVKDYTGKETHFAGVTSTYSKVVDEQYRQQPKYCMPGEVDSSGTMKGARVNKQTGPKI